MGKFELVKAGNTSDRCVKRVAYTSINVYEILDLLKTVLIYMLRCLKTFYDSVSHFSNVRYMDLRAVDIIWSPSSKNVFPIFLLAWNWIYLVIFLMLLL